MKQDVSGELKVSFYTSMENWTLFGLDILKIKCWTWTQKRNLCRPPHKKGDRCLPKWIKLPSLTSRCCYWHWHHHFAANSTTPLSRKSSCCHQGFINWNEELWPSLDFFITLTSPFAMKQSHYFKCLPLIKLPSLLLWHACLRTCPS